jgi:hypothetical protein
MAERAFNPLECRSAWTKAEQIGFSGRENHIILMEFPGMLEMYV